MIFLEVDSDPRRILWGFLEIHGGYMELHGNIYKARGSLWNLMEDAFFFKIDMGPQSSRGGYLFR